MHSRMHRAGVPGAGWRVSRRAHAGASEPASLGRAPPPSPPRCFFLPRRLHHPRTQPALATPSTLLHPCCMSAPQLLASRAKGAWSAQRSGHRPMQGNHNKSPPPHPSMAAPPHPPNLPPPTHTHTHAHTVDHDYLDLEGLLVPCTRRTMTPHPALSAPQTTTTWTWRTCWMMPCRRTSISRRRTTAPTRCGSFSLCLAAFPFVLFLARRGGVPALGQSAAGTRAPAGLQRSRQKFGGPAQRYGSQPIPPPLLQPAPLLLLHPSPLRSCPATWSACTTRWRWATTATSRRCAACRGPTRPRRASGSRSV